MFYIALSLFSLLILLSSGSMLWVLHHEKRRNMSGNTEIFSIGHYDGNEVPVYEIPVLISIDASSDLDVVEKLICEVCLKVSEERASRAASSPVIKYRTLNKTYIEFIVLLKVNSLSDKYAIKNEFIRLLKKRLLQNGVKIPFPNYSDLYLIG
jgi:small-conductance mechanosensitive channel